MAFLILKHVILEINRFYDFIFLQRLFNSYLAIPGPSVQEYKIFSICKNAYYFSWML